MRFGANYIPSKNWLHSWINWDADSIREDIVSLKSIGIDHIRAHLVWPYFQLDVNAMSPDQMKHLEDFCEICKEEKMDFFLSLFTGWLSGIFYFPAFMRNVTGAHGVGMFTHPTMLTAEENYIREISEIVTQYDCFLGFDLGNELSCITMIDKEVSGEQMDAWNEKMYAVLEKYAPGRMHTNGIDHQPWFKSGNFSAKEIANSGKMIPLHTYARFTGALNYGRMSTESIHLAPFIAEIAKAWADDENKIPICIQEFGTVNETIDSEIIEFVDRSLDAMTTIENLWGITWWCSHNVSREYQTFAEIEYELGLFDNENNLTESGRLVCQKIKQFKNQEKPPKRDTALILDPYDENGNITPQIVWKCGERYAREIEKGNYPKIVLKEKANDKDYLARRGITKLL